MYDLPADVWVITIAGPARPGNRKEADVETCDKCGPGTEAHVSFMTPQGPIAFCRHHARKFAAALRAYPSTPVGRAPGAWPAFGTRVKPTWRGVMWRPA